MNTEEQAAPVVEDAYAAHVQKLHAKMEAEPVDPILTVEMTRSVAEFTWLCVSTLKITAAQDIKDRDALERALLRAIKEQQLATEADQA